VTQAQRGEKLVLTLDPSLWAAESSEAVDSRGRSSYAVQHCDDGSGHTMTVELRVAERSTDIDSWLAGADVGAFNQFLLDAPPTYRSGTMRRSVMFSIGDDQRLLTSARLVLDLGRDDVIVLARMAGYDHDAVMRVQEDAVGMLRTARISEGHGIAVEWAVPTASPAKAASAALRHGRWQIVIYVAGMIVALVVMLTQPDTVSEGVSDRAFQAAQRPWSSIVVGIATAWGLVLAWLIARHCAAIAADRWARAVFRNASLALLVIPVLPGTLLWGRWGWGASAIGLLCLVVTLMLPRLIRR
jgi:hypothetical protein